MIARATQTATATGRAKKTATSASSKRQSAAARPPAASAPVDRRTYEPRLETATLADLPFTQGGEFGEPLQAWAPAKVKTYGEACLLGAEYAAHWLQFVKDSGGKHYVYTLGGIVQAMDFEDASAAKGVIVGFFAHIERVVRGAVQCFDVYEDLDLATAHLRPQREPETRGAKRGRIT
jgi:hypothetical protein